MVSGNDFCCDPYIANFVCTTRGEGIVKERQEMEMFVVMSFRYPYVALRMLGAPVHFVLQNKCPLFDTFYSRCVEASV